MSHEPADSEDDEDDGHSSVSTGGSSVDVMQSGSLTRRAAENGGSSGAGYGCPQHSSTEKVHWRRYTY